MSAWVTNTGTQFAQALSRHHRLLLTKLESASRGVTDRLMIQLPPGSAKSTYASILLPAWWFTQHPRASIIAASHTAGLATYFGRRARTAISEASGVLGFGIAQNARSNAQWSTTAGGEYLAVGVRGAIVGRRADLAIIDDPIKSQAEVDKISYRDHPWEWYRSDLTPRLKPKACIILVMTRWHEDDLCGRLLEREPNQWDCLRLPALAEEVDQLQRTRGEALWPRWEGIPDLKRRRATLGDRAWSAQFQQSPIGQGSQFFDVSQVEYVDIAQGLCAGKAVRAWDLAATADANSNDPDWTVGLKLMRRNTGEYIVLEVVRFRGSPRRVEEAITSTARADGMQVPIGLPEDPGQAGKSQIAYLASCLAGHHIVSSRESGAKTTRAMPVASQIGSRNFAILRASWNHSLVEELRDFPYGRKDDQVDALSRAFNMLLTVGNGVQDISLSHMGR